MNFGAITRRIRRCESEVPAQLVLEHAIKEAVEAERAACANLAEKWRGGYGMSCTHTAEVAAAIRKRSNAELCGGTSATNAVLNGET